MKKIKWLRTALLLALVLILAVGCQGQAPSEQADEQPVEKEVKRQIELYGTVAVRHSLDISLDKLLKVTKVYVKEGQVVKAGDALFQVDLTNLRADAALLKSKIDLAEKQLSDENYDVQKFSVNIGQVKNKLADAQSTLANNRKLLNSGAISQREYDASKQVVEDLKSNLSKAQLDFSNIVDKDDQAAQAKLVEIAEYTRKYDEIMNLLNSDMLDGDDVVAPVESAVVAKMRLQEGAYLNAFTSALSLDDLNSLDVLANVIEEQIDSVKVGQAVTITPTMDSDLELTGKIDFISSRAIIVNNETVVPIEIVVDDSSKLMPNLNVDVVVPLDEK